MDGPNFDKFCHNFNKWKEVDKAVKNKFHSLIARK